jgi:hypothetical protein
VPESPSIKLFYALQKGNGKGIADDGQLCWPAVANASDRPFIAALCEAAYKAMSKGGTVAVVDFIIRAKNTMHGIGFGTSGGATGLPAGGPHPYAVARMISRGASKDTSNVRGGRVSAPERQFTIPGPPGGLSKR